MKAGPDRRYTAEFRDSAVKQVIVEYIGYYNTERRHSSLGIGTEYAAPAEAFMLLELQPGYMREVSGTVQFHAAFKT